VGELLNDLEVTVDLAEQVGHLLTCVHVPARGSTSYIDFASGRASREVWSKTFAASMIEVALGCGYEKMQVDELLKVCAEPITDADENLVLVHNDVHFKNIILRPSGSLCLIDWDSAMIAPPEKDFVKLLDWSHQNRGIVESIIESY